MCLAVPGRIESILDDQPLTRTGRVSFGGIVKEVNLSCTPEASVGDYVVVHVGFAIAKVDEQEAQKTLEYLQQMSELGEIEEAGS
jgi:hydrogenase expression/formation protein HypC